MSRSHGAGSATRISRLYSCGRLISAGLVVITALGCILLSRNGVLRVFPTENVSAQGQTASIPGSPATEATLPANLQASEPSPSNSTPGRQVLIDFSNLPFYAAVTNQYPDAIFSSDSSNYVITTPQNYGTALPTISRAYVYGYWSNGNPPYNHFAPLVVSFPKPVNDLVFHLLASDDGGVIAYVDIDQNYVYTKTEPIFGNASPFSPISINLGAAGYKNVTRIMVRAIADRKGLAFDNFSFTVPAATPTPTPTPSPTPTPPPAPTNVKATPDEEEIRVSWTPSQGAGWYIVKRTEQQSTGTTNAPESESPAFATINPSFFCDGVSVPCFYDDDNGGAGLSSDIFYTHIVVAANTAGSSADSNPVTSKPLPKGACQPNPTATPIPRAGFVLSHGWGMNYFYTDNDGLVLNNIFLNGRTMAKQFSIPYFMLTIFNSRFGTVKQTRGELTFAGTGNSMRARLLNYKIDSSDPTKLLLEADYGIDRIPDAPKSCLTISQKYEFYKPGYQGPPELTGPCEPSGTLSTCAKYRPMVEYSFRGTPVETLSKVNIPIRLHYTVLDGSGNTVALLRDLDTIPEMVRNLSGFRQPENNPLFFEWKGPVIVPSWVNPTKDANTMDSFHQTSSKVAVSEPRPVVDVLPDNKPWLYVGPGCPECVHLHWRWSKLFNSTNGYSPVFGAGSPIVPPGDQSVDLAVLRYKSGEEHPNSYSELYTQGEPIRDPHVDRVLCCGGGFAYFPTPKPFDVVFWYSATGFHSRDTFFWHTSWFKAQNIGASATTFDVANANGPLEQAEGSQDGPTSVQFGSVYEPGETTFAPFDLSILPPLPPGYSALNNLGYKITTTGDVAGPYQVNFSAQSITDQTDFSNLRVFHAEPDSFDPDRPVWVDATILSPNTPGPDFTARTLSARSGELGVFVVGRLSQTVPTDSAVADVGVSTSDSADPVTASNDLTYTFTVSNNGPQAATEVALMNPLSPDVSLTSVTPSQGTCKQAEGVLYCNLNSLPVGGTAAVSVVVKPIEGSTSFPEEGKVISTAAIVRARQADNNQANNSATEDTKILPNPNKAPIVSITSPITGALFTGPVNISVNASASDSDGTISKVEFFDNGELIGEGTPAGNNQYVITKQNASFGDHSLIAVATDNGGRQNISNAANVIVNGAASVGITSPSVGALFSPASNVTVSANATHPSGIINKVEFFANGAPIGIGILTGGSQYSIAWNNVNEGTYSIVAVATDGSEIATASTPVNITVGTPPSVTMSTPANGSVFPSLTNISVSATAQSAHGSITRVDFYANGVLVAGANDVGTDGFIATWRHLADGFYSITAVATDNLGLSSTSAPITIGVNTPSSLPGEFIWFDDALPPGAIKHADGDVDWYWVDANPGAFSGTKSHQSRSFGSIAPPNSFHQHSFDGATTLFPVNPGDKLFTYVFLDVNDLPREIMLQWKDGSGWEHRAYWGANAIAEGIDGTNSRRYMGGLPEAGMWARLEVPANLVGLEGTQLNGMAFTLDGGRATFDLAGKATANAAPPPTTPAGDFVWMEDDLPPGAVISFTDDGWNFVTTTVYSGQRAHQTHSMDGKKFRQHAFTGAQTPMQVNPGDVLFSYVYLGDPDLNHQPNTPDQIMVQWYDGTSWSHRAFWGTNWIGQNISNMGRLGTEQQRYMGGLPAARGWYRLEVPASYVGLEGKSVSGMAFSAYRGGNNPFVTWDRSGKSGQLKTGPLVLSSTASVWRFFNSTYGWAFEANDQPPSNFGQPTKDVFFVYPNQAAGTVPMHRFHKHNSQSLLYSTCRDCYPTGWDYDNIPFYVFVGGSAPAPPGMVPLWLYHDNQFRYFLTIDQNEPASFGMNFFDGPNPWAYVFPTANLIPVRPTALTNSSCTLNWTDNSNNETGFKIEARASGTYNGYSFKRPKWVQIATVEADVNSFGVTCSSASYYRVRAYNSRGNSGYSNEIGVGTGGGPIPKDYDPTFLNSAPEIDIVSPTNGDVVDQTFAIDANAFDIDGNGSIATVEFFANGSKIGEVLDAPYVFLWKNVPSGTYNLTATALDDAGVTTTSPQVSVTVSKLDQTITFDPISDKTYGDAPFSINASASSGLPVSFNVVSGPASLSSNTITLTGAGEVTLRASQAGDTTYNAATDVDRTFTVAKGTATISLSNLSQTYDGTPKTATATTNPAALSGVAITYDGSSTAPTNPGNYSVVASLANDNYTATNATGTLAIKKASQTITFNALPNKTYGDSPFTLNASSSSGLAVGFSIVSGPATISGSTVTITGAGTVVVRASQSGDSNYNAATNVDQTFSVAKASATIALSNLSQTYDGTPKPAITTTNPAGLTWLAITYNGSSIIPTNAGAYSVVASLTNDNYAASNVTGTLTIATATPVLTWQKPLDIGSGTALGSDQLNATANIAGTFAYSPAAGTILNIGNDHQLSVTFTPANSNYNAVTTSVGINVVMAILLADDFNDNSLNAVKWHVLDPASPQVVSEQSQQLQIALTPNTVGYNGISSNGGYDFSGRTVQVEVTQPIGGGWCEYLLTAQLDWDNYFMIVHSGQNIVFRSRVNGVNDNTTIVNDSAAHRYWRIRHDQTMSTVNFDTSSDATNWTVRKTVPVQFAITNLGFNLIAGEWGTGNANPGAARWDNFQLVTNETANSLPISNSGFEFPVQLTSGFQYGPTDAGWSFVGAGESANNSGFTSGNPPAPELNQVAFLQGGGGASISQLVSGFQSNQTYVVRFAAAQRANNAGEDFQVFLDTVLLGTFRPSSMGYIEYSTPSFTTTTGAHTLKFAGLNSAGGDNTAFLDNVRVIIQTNGAVSKPSLNDDFNAGALNTGNWTLAVANSTRVQQQLQQLQITIPPNTAVYDGIYSNATYDLTGRMVQVEVAQPISQAGWCENYIQVLLDGSNYFLIDAGGGSMVFRSMVGGVNNQTIAPFDPATQRYWRIRHDAVANTIIFETSADGNIWTTRKTAAVGFSLTSLRFFLIAGAWGTANSAPGVTKYDNFQLLSSTNVFSDEFNRSSLDSSKWTVADASSSAVITDNGQHLQITLQPNAAAYNGIYSNSTYDLNRRMVQVEVAQPISQGGWCENFMQAVLDGSNYLLIDAGGGSMVFRSMVGGVNNQTISPFDPVTQRYWRIRHDAVANTIVFETSADGNTWTTRKTAAVGFSLSSLRFSLYAGAWGTGNSAPGAAKYDNFQLLDSAYAGAAQAIPGTIEVENYDNGGGEVAYHDTTLGSHGQDYDQPPAYPAPTYRQPTNVDIYKATGGYSNGHLVVMQGGDWMKHSVNVAQSGTYTIYARVAWGGGPGGTFHIEVDGVDKTGPIQIPNSNWSFAVVSKSGVQLTSGMHSLRLVADTDGTYGYTGDIDYLYFRLNP